MTAALELLVADDSPDDVFLLRQAFKKAGVTAPFSVVGDGAEAVAYLQGQGAYHDRAAHPFPDVLLLDLNMPQRNGFEVLEWIRQDERCSRLTVHVLTASARPRDVERVYELGANSYVVKPSRMDDLAGFVAALHAWHSYVSVTPRPTQ